MGIVEKVAFNAPSLAIHLLPFSPRIDVDFHVSQFERAIAGLGSRVSARDEPLLALPVKHFLAVGGEIEPGYAFDNFVRLASLEVELIDSDLPGALL